MAREFGRCEGVRFDIESSQKWCDGRMIFGIIFSRLTREPLAALLEVNAFSASGSGSLGIKEGTGIWKGFPVR
jgi:hypothetical protein